MTAPNTTDTGPEFDNADPMDRIIQSTLQASSEIVAADVPITGRPRDAQTGKFVSVAEGQQATEPGAWNTIPDANAETADPATPPAPIIPEGHVALPALAPEKVQGFKVMDTEGEIVPPDLRFEVNFRKGANGESETRTLDVPQLVNYARMGVYNHEREQQAIAIRNDNTTLQTRLSEYDRHVEQMQREREQLLSDPAYLLRELERHEQANTPEARLAREREQLVHDQQQQEFTRAATTNTQYLETQVLPAFNTIVQSLPTVTSAELADRLSLLIEPFKVRTQFGTIINPNAFGRIEQAIVHELVPWAQQVHMDRDARAPRTPQPAPKPTPDPKVLELQTRAAKAKRVATAALQPAGGNGHHHGPPANATPPTSTRDMESFIIGRSLAGTRTG